MLAVACVYRPDDADQVIASFATKEDARACERFLRPARRRQSLTARALLRAMLAQLFGQQSRSWSITYRSDNSPQVVAPNGREPAQVSIAHSQELVACAATDLGQIGIDVERCAPRRRIDLAAATFGKAEQAAVDREGATAFYKIWTLREAMAKASGLGIAKMAARHDLFAGALASKSWSTTLGRQHWNFHYQTLLRGRYALSLAMKTPIDR